MPLRHLAISLASRPRLPPRTIRLRLTAVYAVVFLVSGAGLLAITYVLVSAATASNCYQQPLPTANRHPASRAVCIEGIGECRNTCVRKRSGYAGR